MNLTVNVGPDIQLHVRVYQAIPTHDTADLFIRHCFDNMLQLLDSVNSSFGLTYLV